MNLQQKSPFLRQQRSFPDDNMQALGVELDRSYIDIAQIVNDRIIGVFTVGNFSVTGESWFLNGSSRKQQGLRRVYQFTGAGSIPHGITWSSVSMITHPTGSYTNGTNWYGVIYSTNVGLAGQVTFYVTPTNIVVVADAAAPSIVSGIIILEWVSQF